MTSSFRHHDARPPLVASPLYRQLIDEWIELNRLRSSQLALRRWARTEPVLAGYERPADLVDAVDAASSEEQDRHLIALIRLAQADHQLAGRVLLQLMLPKLGRITNRTAGTTSDSTWAEDRRHIVVAEFWDVVVTYPAARRGRRVAANLSLETLRRVTDPRGHHADQPVDPQLLGQPAQRGGEADLPLPGQLSTDSSLDEVVAWAVEEGVITRSDGLLLTRVYLPQPGPSATAEVAQELGCSAAALRQRCSRARRQLVAAVQDHLAAGLVGSAA